MIKPFKVTKTVVEPEGNIGVHFIATKSASSETNRRGAMSIQAYLSVSADSDIDQEVYNYLKEEWL
mgnify:CR=1 FL=1